MMFVRFFIIAFGCFCVLFGTFTVANSEPPPSVNVQASVDALLLPAVQALFKGALKGFLWILSGTTVIIVSLCKFIVSKYIKERNKETAEIKFIISKLDKKLDVVHDVLLSCDGCRDAAKDAGIKYGRREGDDKQQCRLPGG